ncbi:hypothetical protein LTR28_010107, partial [Elasticomyces elasticus]
RLSQGMSPGGLPQGLQMPNGLPPQQQQQQQQQSMPQNGQNAISANMAAMQRALGQNGGGGMQ